MLGEALRAAGCMPGLRAACGGAGVALVLLAACAPSAAPYPASAPALAAPAIVADSARERVIAPGVVQRHYYVARGPWRVDVLDVDRAACWTTVAVKGGHGAIGRRTTSALAGALARTDDVAGAVNADFFLFAPPGVPTNLHVEDGRMLTGPNVQPVFATRGDPRTPWMGTVTMRAGIVIGRDTIEVQSYNRATRTGVAWIGSTMGGRVDSLAGHVVVRLLGLRETRGRESTRWMVGLVDTTLTSVMAMTLGAAAGTVDGRPAADIGDSGEAFLIAGPQAPRPVRDRLLRLRSVQDTIRSFGLVRESLSPGDIRDAVGGRPILVTDSAEVAGLDSSGGRNFGPVRHPRTAVGIAANGRRLFLLSVDGRRDGWSAGMTLREMAALMLSLGATEAINLDGGGSTALVVRDSAGNFRPANRPSDPTGERPVANALAVVRDSACARSRGTR